ncbi:MAG: arabinose efflux permease family protein [Bacillales bacterium]|nr:arabinose efflux permease family protein [Bacillales bacterium]
MFILSRLSSSFGYQMLAVAVGWQMYAITKSTFYLGMVGLVQFIPLVLLTFVSGHMADRYNRKWIISISQITSGLSVLVLAWSTYEGWINKEILLLLSFIIGAAMSFSGPAQQSMLPNIIEKKDFPKAVAISSSFFEFSVIIGPSLGGIFYAINPEFVYVVIGGLLLIASFLIQTVTMLNNETKRSNTNRIKEAFAGLSFIKSRPAILGALSLDMFAVLLGGATALLPVYASEILKIGPLGLGVLRSAPSVGALLVSIYLAKHPLKKNVGRTMFKAVICFGLATIVFGISNSLIVSFLALFVLGASDVVSVVIRQTFVQMETPDELRGRVSSVNFLFIGTSNQLGEFESGITASAFGVVPAVLIGGIGTVVIALLWMRLFPTLLKIDKLEHAHIN